MLLFETGKLLIGLLDIASIGSFLVNHPFLIAIIAIVMVFLLLVYRFSRKKSKKGKKDKQEVIPPVHELLPSSELLEELNKDLKPFGFAYDPNQDIFYSLMNCWQREVGYCRLYDEATAPLSMIIDCEPIRFDYAGRKWLVEFWKGQYGMTSGGEVGIYYTKGPDLNIPGIFYGTFYYCVKDEDRINMSFVFRKNGNLLFTRSDHHWWLTGFKLAEFSQPSDLSMDIILELYDKEMCAAFVEALKKAGYTSKEYYVKGKRVYVSFSTPHSSQPLTRSPLTISIMQRNNEAFCNAYKRLTQDYTETLDKLMMVRSESPNMYKQILNMGKTFQVFHAYKRLKTFISKDPDNNEE